MCILTAILSPETDQCLLRPNDPSPVSPCSTASINLHRACPTAMARIGLMRSTGVLQPIVTGSVNSS